MRDRGQGSGRAMPRKGSRMDNSNFVDKKRPKESLQYLRSSTTPSHPHSVHRCPSLLYPGNWFSLSILLGTPNTDNSLFLSIIIKMVQPILYIATAPPTPLSIAQDDDTIYNTFPVQESARGLGSTTIPIYQYNIHEYLRCPSQPPLLASSFTHSLVDAPSRPSIYTQSLCTQQARTLSLNLLLLKNVFANPKFTVLGH